VFVFQEPPRTGLELRWRLFGIRVRVYPSFFLIAAIFAYLFVGPNLVAIAIDVACIFVSILFTEYVQGLVYKSYGLRSTILIREFGGGVYPEAEPPLRIQRIVAALSSPASAFLLFAIVYYSNQHWDWRGTHPYAGFAYFILYVITLFWGIIGFLPMFPYPGGRVVMEVLDFVSPRYGVQWALWLSILIGLAIIADTVAFVLGQGSVIPFIRELSMPMRVILAVFFALATMQNWQFLQMVRAQRRQYSSYNDYRDDDRAPWER
jgi:hypothetical protein